MMTYATDLVDEGFDSVLDRLRERGAIDGVEMAAIYHHARDLYPHNPAHQVHFADGGACFFRLDRARYRSIKIKPKVAALVEQVDPLATLVETARRKGMSPRAWTINLHNMALGEAYPDCTTRNVFGNPLLTDLCPANPDVRAYVAAVSGDISHYGVEAILAESITYMPFDHGFHHERCPYPLAPTVKYLLSFCFCDNCEAAFSADGADVPGVKAWVRSALLAAIAGEPSPLDDVPLLREEVASLMHGEMRPLLDTRERIVSSLVAEVAEAVHLAGPAQFVFMDSMPADDAGDQTGPPLVDRTWQFGVDLDAIARASDGVSVIGYSRSHDRYLADLEAYERRLPTGAVCALVLRAMPPDCFAPDELADKVRVARAAGLAWVEFFVYGLMRLSGMDWIGQALRAD